MTWADPDAAPAVMERDASERHRDCRDRGDASVWPRASDADAAPHAFADARALSEDDPSAAPPPPESNPAARPGANASARIDDPDAALIAEVGRQDPAAVRTLVARKLPRLLALAQRMLGDRAEAEDVAQDAFVRIWKQAPTWRAGEAKFDTWLHRVVLNLCYDRLRAHREKPLGDDLNDALDASDADGTATHTVPPPDQALDARSRAQRVRAAIDGLPVRQREALVLTYYQELSNIDAAALMGVSVDALESLLARARRTLKSQLAGDGPTKDES